MKILLVSPRKSGTHLFQKLFDTILPFQGKLEIGSDLDGFYSLSNTFHTSFSQYFKQLDRDDFTGGKLLPIPSSLGVIICRHPLDVLLSHLEFSFTKDNTCFSNINLCGMEDKLNFVLTHDFYEDFFKEHLDYTAWSRLNNFITVAYEDAVESFKQTDSNDPLIGSMADLAKHFKFGDTSCVYGSSATFNEGKTGRGLEFFKNNYPQVFENKDYIRYCEYYGYSTNSMVSPTKLAALNDKTIHLEDSRVVGTPMLVQENFLDYRIIYFNTRIYAIPNHTDFFKELSAGNIHCVGKSVEEVKGLISAYVMIRATQ